MAESSEELSFIIRMLFPGADTREAEAALDKLQQKARIVKSEVASASSSVVSAAGMPAIAAAGAIGYGGAPFTMGWDAKTKQTVFTYPVGSPYAPPAVAPPDPRAGATWATRPQYGPWNSSWGMGYGAQGTGGYAHGPVSDPGTFASASQGSAAAYSSAMYGNRDQRAAQFYAAADDAGGSFNKATVGINQLGLAATNLAAGIVLLNKAAEDGADAWANFQTKFIGGMNVAVGGGMALRGGYNLATGAGGLAGRGVNLAAGAATMAGFSRTAGALGRLGAPLSVAGMALGGLAVGGGLGVAAYLGYELYEANQQNEAALARGQELDLQIGRQNSMRRQAFWRPFDQRRTAAEIGMRVDSLRLQGSGDFSRFHMNALGRLDTLQRDEAQLLHMATNRSADPRDQQDANRQLEANLQAQLRLTQQLNSENRYVLQSKQEQLRAEQQLTEVERSRAGSAAGSYGRMSPSDRRRRDRLVDQIQANGLNWRNASALERLGGATSETDAYFRGIGQAGIDSTPEGFRPIDSRSSDQLKELADKIKQLETQRQQTAAKISETFDQQATIEERLINKLDAVGTRLSNLENRLLR